MKDLGFLRRLGLVSVFLLSVVALVACEEVPMDDDSAMMDDGKSMAEEIVTIGGVAPLSGNAADYGLPLQRVAQFAQEEINAAGGINGKKLNIIWEDAFCNKEAGNKSANKLINVDGVKVILGGFCSDETLGIASIAENKGVIVFSPSSSSPKITDAGDYIFRNWPSDSSQGKIMAKYAIDKGFKKVGVIYEQTDYALGIKDTFERTLGDAEIEVNAESFSSETSDFRAQLLKLKGAGVDVLLIDPQTPAKAEGIVKQLKEMDFKVQLLGNDVFMGATDVVGNYADYLEGTVGAEGSYNDKHPDWVALEAKYREKYGEDIPYAAYMASGYDAVHILAEAIGEVGYDADAIRDYLYGIKNREGVAGSLTIDENGDPESGHVLRMIKGGEVMNYEG